MDVLYRLVQQNPIWDGCEPLTYAEGEKSSQINLMRKNLHWGALLLVQVAPVLFPLLEFEFDLLYQEVILVLGHILNEVYVVLLDVSLYLFINQRNQALIVLLEGVALHLLCDCLWDVEHAVSVSVRVEQPKGLLEDFSLLLTGDLVIIKAPPLLGLPLVDEGVVVARLSPAIMDHNRMQIVGKLFRRNQRVIDLAL